VLSCVILKSLWQLRRSKVILKPFWRLTRSPAFRFTLMESKPEKSSNRQNGPPVVKPSIIPFMLTAFTAMSTICSSILSSRRGQTFPITSNERIKCKWGPPSRKKFTPQHLHLRHLLAIPSNPRHIGQAPLARRAFFEKPKNLPGTRVTQKFPAIFWSIKLSKSLEIPFWNFRISNGYVGSRTIFGEGHTWGEELLKNKHTDMVSGRDCLFVCLFVFMSVGQLQIGPLLGSVNYVPKSSCCYWWLPIIRRCKKDEALSNPIHLSSMCFSPYSLT